MSTWSFPRADVVRVIDGDNVELDIISDIGFNDTVSRRRSFRLLGINARELDQPGGVEAQQNLAKLLPVGSSVRLQSVKLDKFGGRYDALIYLPSAVDDRDTINGRLVLEWWAASWNGQGSKPVPPWPRPVAP